MKFHPGEFSLRNVKAILTLSTTFLLFTACVSHPEPIIDTKGVNMAAYQQDLQDCTKYGEQVKISKGVTKGAAAGGAVGGATGAVWGDAGKGAAAGAIGGAARSAQMGEREKSGVVKRCLSGRGYKVLN